MVSGKLPVLALLCVLLVSASLACKCGKCCCCGCGCDSSPVVCAVPAVSTVSTCAPTYSVCPTVQCGHDCSSVCQPRDCAPVCQPRDCSCRPACRRPYCC